MTPSGTRSDDDGVSARRSAPRIGPHSDDSVIERVGPHVTPSGRVDLPYLGIDADRHDYLDATFGVRVAVGSLVLSLGVFKALGACACLTRSPMSRPTSSRRTP